MNDIVYGWSVYGWSQAFKHCTTPHVFQSLDREIDQRLARLKCTARDLTKSGSAAVLRRVMGVHLLADTQPQALH